MSDPRLARPWPAVWSLIIGFFMILLDSTIVSVATPHIMAGLGAGISEVVWVTSAYLLAFAVPLLITGRMGDRFGPRRIYLAGLAVFTAASAWCGLAGSIGALVLARAVQGLGASLMSPQTMASITRLFPPHERGAAMGVWGSVAGVAGLAGPLLGGFITDVAGWAWIFFINVPLGLLAMAMVARHVPRFATHPHRFDHLGVLLSGTGSFCLVLGIQEGQARDWGQVLGPATAWHLVAAGVVLLAAFAAWQLRNPGEPLIPPGLFRNRNFALANAAICAIGAGTVAMSLPLMIYLQLARGLAPTRAALVLVPSAICSVQLAPVVGANLGRRLDPNWTGVAGLALTASGMLGFAAAMTPDGPVWHLYLPSAILGIANSMMWASLSLIATRDLTGDSAGAGAGVYNATRQLGSVLGSAAIAALMEARVAAALPGADAGAMTGRAAGTLPEAAASALAQAMRESMLLPALALLTGTVIAFGLRRVSLTPRPAIPPGAGP